jgi:riboflavin synthase
VEERGEVVALAARGETATLTVAGPLVTADAGHGDSIGVNGVCLTVTALEGTTFTADVMAETLARTTLGGLAPGTPVNLERPLSLGGRLGGHLVQGHVDAVGTIASRRPGENTDVVRISLPSGLARYVVAKGSVAVDGVSLTVSAVSGGAGPHWFEVSLIPATLALTTLGAAQPGSHVNLEVDVIGKYVERLLGGVAAAGEPAVRP